MNSAQVHPCCKVDELHKSAFPFASVCKEELIKVRRLDDIVAELKLSDNILIKIDVQGFEDKVIRGGENTIKKSKILIVETSVETLYQGQPLFNDIYSLLVGCGFSFKGAEEPLRHPRSRRILQFDSIFTNNISI